ncbi:MAG: endo-1,4-beta-xylanase [Phycisphaerales bacterium]|nr:endo-1,4-beta-xylanase [Phycisphaerales bacterium]|tara:strand:+ start:4113 stop:5612 length:1500 start_codon:yes stop_codon:yes gene_type:complete
MLQFAVFKDSAPADDWSLNHARLLDRDDLVVPGEIDFKNGLINCNRRGVRPTALLLQYDAGDSGRLSLQTCLLPHREKPYILSVELARHRIAIFLAQAEIWQMHLSQEHPAMAMVQSARQIFTRAMVTPDPVKADANGFKALGLALKASELLALAHAEVLIHRRYKERPASRATFGTAVWPKQAGPVLQDFVKNKLNFELVRIPMEWGVVCPQEGVYDWEKFDRWVEWAVESKCMIIAGPLVNFNPGRMPLWMEQYKNDFGEICDRAYDYVQNVVQRYGDNIGMYSVLAGVQTNLDYQLNLKQMIDLVRTLALVVRQGQRNRRVMVELNHLWGEYLATERDAVAPISFIEQLLQEGIRLDAVGLQILFGDARHAMPTRDLMELSKLVDRFLHLEPKLVISSLGVPDSVVDENAGWWHSRWSPERQARWVSQALMLLLSKPFVEAAICSDLYDHELTVPAGGGLLSVDGKPKPVLKSWVALKKYLSKPLGRRMKSSDTAS